MTIPRPHRQRSHPDRFDECQMAIEDRLIELIGEASDCGWPGTKYFRLSQTLFTDEVTPQAASSVCTAEMKLVRALPSIVYVSISAVKWKRKGVRAEISYSESSEDNWNAQ